MANPKASAKAEENKEPRATDAAERLAEEKGVALVEAEPSGADGSVTVQDVEVVARDKELAEERRVQVIVNPASITGSGDIVIHDGVTYSSATNVQPVVVTERYFDEELAPLESAEGVPYFVKGEEVIPVG